jgi:hypothetical protein
MKIKRILNSFSKSFDEAQRENPVNRDYAFCDPFLVSDLSGARNHG